MGYKAFYAEFSDDPLPSRSSRGRFHDSETGRFTTYMAERPSTAWREVTHRWRAEAAAFQIAVVRLRLGKLADLTRRSTQQRYGVDRDALVGDEYRRCQTLAQRLRANGFEAAWTYSRADQPEGRVLVVFLDGLIPPSRIERVEVRPVTPDETGEDAERHERRM
jgi:RES domain-containing protein